TESAAATAVHEEMAGRSEDFARRGLERLKASLTYLDLTGWSPSSVVGAIKSQGLDMAAAGVVQRFLAQRSALGSAQTLGGQANTDDSSAASNEATAGRRHGPAAARPNSRSPLPLSTVDLFGGLITARLLVPQAVWKGEQDWWTPKLSHVASYFDGRDPLRDGPLPYPIFTAVTRTLSSWQQRSERYRWMEFTPHE
ncbi:hypothetical protein HK405_002503, partial [Cladochytrium tenue]